MGPLLRSTVRKEECLERQLPGRRKRKITERPRLLTYLYAHKDKERRTSKSERDAVIVSFVSSASAIWLSHDLGVTKRQKTNAQIRKKKPGRLQEEMQAPGRLS